MARHDGRRGAGPAAARVGWAVPLRRIVWVLLGALGAISRPCGLVTFLHLLGRRPAWAGLGALSILALAGCASAPQPSNPARQVAINLSQVAARALARGDLATARGQYESALAAAESVEDFALAGATLLNLALVQSRSADLGGAHARLDRLLAAPQRFGAALHAAAAARKALLLLDQPDLDAASTWASTALATCPAPCEWAAALANLRAHVALQRGDATTALAQALQAGERAQAAGQTAEQANALRLQGRARTRSGQADAAAAALAGALVLDQRLGLSERVALDLIFAGENELSRAQTAAAREFFDRAATVYQAAGRRQAADAVRARMAALR